MNTIISLIEISGSIVYILKYLILDKNCLTIDTSDANDLGKAKFMTQADSGTEKICYYNRNKKDTSFNSFLAVKKQTSSPFEIKVI